MKSMTNKAELDIEKQYITNATISSYLSIIVQKMKKYIKINKI